MTPDGDDLKLVFGGLLASVIGLLTLWVRGWKARAQVSKDAFETRENDSRAGWLAGIERRANEEREMRIASEERERTIYGQLQDQRHETRALQLTVQLRDEKIARQARQIVTLRSVLLAQDPALAPWMRSEFGDMADEPTESGPG